MEHICIANKRNGIQCTKRKVNDHFCKIHTTNEICSTCGSTEISSTDSILKNYGKSLCNACRKVLSDAALARSYEYVIEAEKKNEIQRLEYEEIMRKHVIEMKLLDEQERINNIKFSEIMNGI